MQSSDYQQRRQFIQFYANLSYSWSTFEWKSLVRPWDVSKTTLNKDRNGTVIFTFTGKMKRKKTLISWIVKRQKTKRKYLASIQAWYSVSRVWYEDMISLEWDTVSNTIRPAQRITKPPPQKKRLLSQIKLFNP